MFKKVVESERAELESKSIQYLRDLADVIGVDSPTLMGKEDLIDEILVVLMGGSLDKKKETRGRPKKNNKKNIFAEENNREEVVIEYDSIMPKGLGVGLFSSNMHKDDGQGVGSDYDNYISFYQNRIDDRENNLKIVEDGLLQLNMSPEEAKRVVLGSVDDLIEDSVMNIIYGLIWEEDNKIFLLENGVEHTRKIDITDEVKKNGYDLRTGDEVHLFLNDGHYRILLCNQKDVCELGERPRFEALNAIKPQRKMETIGIVDKVAPIAYGSRNFFCGDVKNSRFLVGKLLSKIAKRKQEFIYAVGLDIKKEDFKILKNSTDFVLNLSSGNLSADNVKLILLHERIKRLVEIGRDVVVYLNGIGECKELLSLLSIGGSFESDGSITIITVGCVDDCKKMEDKVTSILAVKQSGGETPFVYIDPQNSKTLFVGQFLTKEEILEVEEFKSRLSAGLDNNLENLVNNYE